MGRKQAIQKDWSQQEKFNLCIEEVQHLIKGEFFPEIDFLPNKTVGDILFRVLTEFDNIEYGNISVPRNHQERVKKFLIRWKDFLEDEYADEYKMYQELLEI